jgi:transcription-repair coupling factor (superfamily II helicase)
MSAVPKESQILKHFFRVFRRSAFKGAEKLSVPSLPGAGAACFAAAMSDASPSDTLLVITPTITDAERVYADFCALGRLAGAIPLLFPVMLEGDQESQGSRLQVIKELWYSQTLTGSPGDSIRESNQKKVIVTSLPALLQKVPEPAALNAAAISLKVGSEYDFQGLIAQIAAGGYDRCSEVDEPGRMAVRGGIIDLWPPAEPQPWRIEFLDQTIESLRIFDPISQRSVERGAALWVPPCEQRNLRMQLLTKCLPSAAGILWIEYDALRDAAVAITENENHCGSWSELHAAVVRSEPWLTVYSGDPAPVGVPAMPLEISGLVGLSEFGSPDSFHPELISGARQRLFDNLKRRARQGESVIVCADTAGACEMLSHELEETDGIQVLHLALSGGFVMPGLTVATQPDLYASRQWKARSRATPDNRGRHFEHAAELEPGELVVHIDHGVGRFLGTTEIDFNEQRSEVITLEYADGMKIHVPVSQAHLISRYVGVAGHKARLHNLHGKRWSKDKADAERAIADMAAELLETQAQREIVRGFSFAIDHRWLHDFEAAFPYQETPDQSRAIEEVKRDMVRSRPMDRLICGDAGYGKTEVAMRAAFIAVMNHRQVAVLVPTTILAEQHYESFRERMAPYPLEIAVVSRLHTGAHRKKIIADLNNGRVDIVIGTHALLNAAVQFKDLGLLIIDEEQRFGVKHKERLKQARQVVDVLTMSATPIPRTLYLSMTGARDMSLLQTPPRERVAVETRIVPDSDSVMADAIRQELNRNGQIFFLFNRVLTIGIMRRRLQKLVPEAIIAVVHGQMAGAELAAVMRSFEAGAIDLLLCTTIIESGLDIPRANTILVHRADRFGIAQLYQLRGRVGRSSRRGYAWLLLPEHGHIDSDARRRIEALKRHSGLSAGFNLALRDLEIRGSGNLLGAAQSGHIAAIGFGLYCQLLRRTIARFKGEKPPMLIDVVLNLDFLDFSPGIVDQQRSACLPYDYVENEADRMKLHKSLAEAVETGEVREQLCEIEDRYGQAPPAVRRLFLMAELRVAAAARNLGRIECSGTRLCLYRPGRRKPLLVNGVLPSLPDNLPEKRLKALIRIVKKVDSAIVTGR